VLGGTNPERGVDILRGTGLRYCPFPGTVVGHPSVLKGAIDEIAAHARRLGEMDGVHGLDLLAYRHETVNPVALTRAVVDAIEGPVIVAGSIATPAQIADVDGAGAWGFTIGGAIFEGRLPGGNSVPAQVAAVLELARGSGHEAAVG
jgi:pyridoxal biosynthesis lyase PdxS